MIDELLDEAATRLGCTADLIEWSAWPLVFGSTSGPRGGVGGQAMTTFQCVGFSYNGTYIKYCGGVWKSWSGLIGAEWYRDKSKNRYKVTCTITTTRYDRDGYRDTDDYGDTVVYEHESIGGLINIIANAEIELAKENKNCGSENINHYYGNVMVVSDDLSIDVVNTARDTDQYKKYLIEEENAKKAKEALELAKHNAKVEEQERRGLNRLKEKYGDK